MWPLLWGRQSGMVQLTDQTFTAVLGVILLKKVGHMKCDPLHWEGTDRYGPVDWPNLHNYKKVQILIKKCDT